MRLTTAPFLLLALFAAACGARPASVATPAPVADPFAVPPLTPENTWNLDLSTGGRVVVQLRPDRAPNMVERVRTLTRRGFYDGLIFHRVIDGFMAQGGDPKGTGEGGSELPDLKAEFNDLPHVRGVVSAARASDEDSANSQFFLMLAPNLRLDRHYTGFGRIVSGMQYVDAIEKGEPPANPSRVIHATIGNEPAHVGPVVTPPAAPPANAPEAVAPTTPPAAEAPAATPAPTPQTQPQG